MTHELAKEFVDSATFEDCVCKLNGFFYFCYGLTWHEDKGVFGLRIDKYLKLYPETDFYGTVLDIECKTTDECMRHFIEDPIWDGRTYWEAAPDMLWTDYNGEY